MTARKAQKLKRRAARLSGSMLAVTASKWSARKQRSFRDRSLGKFGAASEVRHVDPRAVSS